jgi:hypothetical protein
MHAVTEFCCLSQITLNPAAMHGPSCMDLYEDR